MNEQSPHQAGSAGSPGRDLPSVHANEDGGDLRWELRGRLHAVLQELDVRLPDYDVIKTLLEGAVESIEAAT